MRNGILSLAQSLLTILTYFLVMRQVVSTLGLESLGLWSLTMSLVAFVRLLDLGGGQILARLVATGAGQDERQAQYIDSTALVGLVAFTVLGLVCYFGLKPFLLGSVDPILQGEADLLLLGLSCVLPLNFVALIHLGALDGIGRADIRALCGIASLAIYASIALMMIREHSLMALVYAQLAQHGFAIMATRILLRREIAPLGPIPRRFSRFAFAEAISFGTRLQISLLPMALFDPLCRLLIGRSAGLELLGIYELASKFAASARTLVQAFASPILPEFARLLVKDRSSAKAQFERSQPVVAAVAMLVSTLQIIALPLVSCVLLDSIDPLFTIVSGVLSFAWGLTCVGLVAQLYARAAGQLRQSIVGQWSLLAIGALLVPMTSLLENNLWMLLSPALAILTGHLIAFVGEIRSFGLDPLGDRRATVLGSIFGLSMTAFAVIAVAVMALGSTS